MNITQHSASLPLTTVVNPPTESLRRDNHQRELITKITATHPSIAEKAVASDKNNTRTSNQTNEHINFSHFQEQAKIEALSNSEEENPQEQSQKDTEKQALNNTTEEQKLDNNDQKSQAEDIKIAQLEQRDQEVRAHELAHATKGGAVTGSPVYSYETGPDGNKYATTGSVDVDVNPIPGDPQATIVKMKQVYAAALAPKNPSSQDLRIAANATQNILAAQSELLALKQDKQSTTKAIENDLASKNDTDSNENVNNGEENDFDLLINKTLLTQEVVTSSMPRNVLSTEVQQRAQRINHFYTAISQGNEKPNNYQFKLVV